jgi:hypothetical protein
MPSRRKLIEQVVSKNVANGLGQRFSAGATTAHVSLPVDRQGYLSALIIATAFSLSVADTQPFTFVLQDSNTTDAATFSAFGTATYSGYISAGTTSTDGTVDGFAIDLAGAERYIRVSVTASAATTVTAVVTSAIVLGDGVIEPSV